MRVQIDKDTEDLLNRFSESYGVAPKEVVENAIYEYFMSMKPEDILQLLKKARIKKILNTLSETDKLINKVLRHDRGYTAQTEINRNVKIQNEALKNASKNLFHIRHKAIDSISIEVYYMVERLQDELEELQGETQTHNAGKIESTCTEKAEY